MLLGDAVIDRMRSIHQGALMDRCLILPHTAAAVDEYGMPEPATYPEPTEETPCLFHLLQSREAMGSSETPVTMARLRLPLGTAVVANDRIRMTLLHGDVYGGSQVYEVVGEPRQRYTGLVVDLVLSV